MRDTLEPHAHPSPGYRAGEAWDEAFDKRGVRPDYAQLMASLAGADLAGLRRRVDARLEEREVVFGSAAGPQPFEVDPIPRVLPVAEWEHLRAGLAQRARALGAYVEDVYAGRAIVEAGVVPGRVVDTADHHEPWLAGVPVNPAGCMAGLDLVRGADGVLRVLEDNFRTPSGIAYAATTREVVDGELPGELPRRADPAAAFGLLAAALQDAAPAAAEDPFVVLLSDGPSNSAWWEHLEIARRTGIPVVAGEDLVVRRGRLHARIPGSRARPVDVVYRRTDEDRLSDEHGRATWIAEALLEPVRQGTLSVVNPLGSGVADDKLAHAYVEDMVRFYLHEEPLIESVPTYDLGDPETRDSVMPRLAELVVKPRSGLGGHGVTVCSQATDDERLGVASLIEKHPEAWIAQETVAISTHPTVCEGRMEPRHVDLRPYVIGAGPQARVAPVALTRVAFEAGSLVVNSSQNGGAKDTWLPA